MTLPKSLVWALRSAALADALLVASDYDGCVAPIVSRPQDAIPAPAAMTALDDLAHAPKTTAALVSGRALADLRAVSGAGPTIVLVGSHGSEFAEGFAVSVTDADRRLLAGIVEDLTAIAARYAGTAVEVKPASTVLHVRNASPDDAERALDAVRSGPAARPEIQVTEGKAVIELAVVETSKGVALDTLRSRHGAAAVVYLGDDVTDEKAFAHLSGPEDVSIKVGAGQTRANHRISGTDDVVEVLQLLAELRR